MTDMFSSAPAADPTGEDGGRDKRTLVLAGALAAVVLAAGGWFVLGGGGGDDAAFVAAPVTRAPRAAALAPPAVDAAPVALPVAAEQRGNNPFLALVKEPVAAAAPVTAAAPVAGGAGSAVIPGSAVSPGSVTPTPTSTPASAPTATKAAPVAAPTPTADAPADTYKVTLVSVGALQGHVHPSVWKVDGTRTSVISGQRFGKSGELVVLNYRQGAKGPLAVLQVGDATPRTVAVGGSLEVR